jgi:hypothetical protein
MTKIQILETRNERLIVLEKINKGQQDIKQGNVYSEEQAKERLQKWLK